MNTWKLDGYTFARILSLFDSSRMPDDEFRIFIRDLAHFTDFTVKYNKEESVRNLDNLHE